MAHTFGNVTADQGSNVQLGDVYNIYHQPEPDRPLTFGLRLGSGPLIEPDSFIGRINELEKMVSVLRPGESAVEQRRLLLGGLGGVGKTQLAIAFARLHHASYSSVLWLNATNKLTLNASFRSIAEALHTKPTTKQLNDEEATQHTLKWLSISSNSQWLLIYDNYDEPDQFPIADYIPDTPNGTIVITTRLPDLITGQRMPQIRVTPMEDLDEGLQILQTRCQRDNVRQDPDAQQLARRLAGLPLALATTGAYLRKTTFTFGEYLHVYKQCFNVNPRRPVKLEEYSDKTLYTTWDLTYRQLESDDPLAAKLLQLLAYFNNQEVWFDLLSAGIGQETPAWVQDVLGEHVDFENLMGVLVDYCLVETHPEKQSYSMHNCVHDWTIAQLNQTKSENLFWYAVACIVGKIERTAWSTLSQVRYAPLIPHALHCMSAPFQHLINSDQIPLDRLEQLDWMADLLRQRAQYGPAEQLFLRLLKGYETALGPNHVQMLATWYNMAELYVPQGKLDEAERMYHRALIVAEKLDADGLEGRLGIYRGLGVVCYRRGEYVKAEQAFQVALSLGATKLRRNQPPIIEAKRYLAKSYLAQKKLQEAERIYQQILIECEAVYGLEHPQTLFIVNEFGILCETQGRLEEARDLYLRAVKGFEREFGQEDWITCEGRESLARLNRGEARIDPTVPARDAHESIN